jgi:CSLREA domain-containing protein
VYARMLLVAALLFGSLAASANAASFTVNSTGDAGDAAAGNGVCATGGGVCTLRAAVQEANALGGTDSIGVPSGTIGLGSSLTITAPVTITGAGPDPGETLVDANGNQAFFVDAANVALRQLAITEGFSQGGGAVQVDDGATLALADARLFDNSAVTGGGAMAVDATAEVTVRRTTMEGNDATGGFGGAIWNTGEVFVHESLLFDNVSLRAGAIRNTGGAVLNLRNTTLSGNGVDSMTSAGGGGLVNTGGGFAFLNNATIVENEGRGPTAGNIAGGGIFTDGASTSVVKNSIIANNTDPFGPGDCIGPLTSDSRYNLLEDTAGCGLPAVTTTWVLGEDPDLQALLNNGGPTRTHLPLSVSPVVDAGFPFPPGGPAADSCEATDQRGEPRLLCDIGAVERHVDVPAEIDVDSTADAVDALPGDATCATSGDACTLRAAVMEANRLPGAQTINVPAGTYGFALAPAEGGFDPAVGGDLDLTDDVTVEAAGTTVPIVDANDLSRVFEVSPGTTATLRRLTLRDGTDSSGGGVRVATGTLVLDRTTVAANVASVSGGGVEADGLNPILWIDGSTIRNNVASFSDGGGIDSRGQLVLTASTVRNNESGGAGGGVRVSGAALISRSTIRDNETTGGLGNGGGISGNGLSIDRTTVSGNTAQSQGGGVFGTGTIVNSTLSGNTTATNGGGASTNGSLTLTNVTVAANTATGGGRALHRFGSGSQLLVRNTILADPGGAECAGGAPTSQGDNISSDATCALTAAGDLPSTNAMIDPLGFYGGPTRTHRLQPGSPALDAAAAVGLATDQRGVARPIGPAPDIGAVEGTSSFLSPSLIGALLSLGSLLGDSLTVDLPPRAVPGDLLLISVASRRGDAQPPAGWRALAELPGQLLLARVATGNEPDELAIDVGDRAKAAAASALAIRGQAARAVLAVSEEQGRGRLATATLERVPAGALVLAFQSWTGRRGGTQVTPPAGWTELADGVDASGRLQTSVASFTVAEAQRLDAGFQLTRNGRWSVVLVALRGRSR